MFEIRCIVADKKLHEVLRSLAGKTLEPPVTIVVDESFGPELNGTPAFKGRAEKFKEGGAVAHILTFLKGHKLSTVTASQLKQVTNDHGYAEGGYSYALKKLIKQGKLKTTKDRAVYEVVKNG